MAKNKYHILINAHSGTVSQLGKAALEQIIAKSLIRIETLHILPPDEFFQKLNELKNSNDAILIGGGDGTIKSVADTLIDKDKPFGIIPMGTMNLMARDLNIPMDIEKALNAYARQTTVINVDIGMVNDKPFLCCVGIGTMPEASEFRESNRQQNGAIFMPRLTIFMLNQMDRLKHKLMRASFDGKKRTLKTAALVISNNQYTSKNENAEDNFKRPSLNDGQLGIYSAAPISMWDRVRLIFNLKFGNWHKDPVIEEWEAETACLKTKNQEELISLDGEAQNIETPLNFWVQRAALPLLVPKPET